MQTLNRLLGRLDVTMRAQRDFVADAAHELRSALTAIRLQAGNVAAAKDEAQRRAAIEQLTRGVDRASHMVAQLLTLARLEPGARAHGGTVRLDDPPAGPGLVVEVRIPVLGR